MTRNPFFPHFNDLPTQLPIFPLAGAVVMPGVQLPLNIFEPRYLNMVNDALAGDRLIGMIQPRSETIEDEVPQIHRVGCAGRITSYSETSDGRIVLVLTGVCRFQVRRELETRRGYRRVEPDWERFTIDYQGSEGGMVDQEGFLTSLRAYCNLRHVEIPWDDAKKMPAGELVDLLCSHLPLEPEDKQALIETLDVKDRAELMRGLMDMASASSIGTAEHRH
ncbi:LON peptidase substrate-binding domain-containing protein [Thiococcus pfennigii]|jgi:Lon protease-like protein|uniref:LON peptidase substrate-binding domain-containing protein n=1 Tax=Thiococcus pfennigii TaxID=1057 RepID=UPI00190431BF|nr:LON peptidase substrate-binding domain-containing protein [Thiococcus pfennigii]MBK1701684.1 peptidase S16 [Thiococcus pfennigii]MBK1731819.1 peptidase S16 [Thiococcus pfennigii]